MINTLSDYELEAEYVASLFLKGNIISPSQTHLRMEFAQLPLASIGSDFDDLLVELRDEIISSFGLLDDLVMDAFLHGTEKSILELVSELYQRANAFLPVMQMGLQQKEVQQIQMVEQATSEFTDFEDLSQMLNPIIVQHEGLDVIRANMINLLKLHAGLGNILGMYGTEPQKFSKKRDISEDSDKYSMYLIDLQTHLDEVVPDAIVAAKLGLALQSLGIVKPTNGLDPFQEQVYKNIIEILAHPKDYYKDCKTNGVLNTQVGQLFSTTYPEFYKKFLSMYLDDFESMTFQEQINFRKCFNLPADDSELLQLTNTYIKMSYT